MNYNVSYLLSQPELEVRATMQEENCGDCFGCPVATLLAAEIVHRTNLLLGFAFNTGSTDSSLYTRFETQIANKRAELAEYTSNCNGYNDRRSKESLRPANMCNSSTYKYPRFSVIAGKILELFGI